MLNDLDDLEHFVIHYYPLDKVIGFIDHCDSPYLIAPWMQRLCRNDAYLQLLYSQCDKWINLLTPEMAAVWPPKFAGAYARFVARSPYVPDDESNPCSRRERFIASLLEDRGLSKELRIHLWRAFVFDGVRLPRNVNSEKWDVPKVLYDHHAFRRWLCLNKMPGWQDLRCSDPLFFENDPATAFNTDEKKALYEAIVEDSVSGLMMPMAISGMRLTKTIMRTVMKCKALNIATYLYKNNKTFRNFLTPREFLLYACANWSDKDCVPFVSMLEEDNPGLVADTLDGYGHNALWYTMYNQNEHQIASDFARFNEDPLDLFLVEHGCDPDRSCTAGLSFKELTIDASSEAVAAIFKNNTLAKPMPT